MKKPTLLLILIIVISACNRQNGKLNSDNNAELTQSELEQKTDTILEFDEPDLPDNYRSN